jgi:hypothetical protein
MATLKKQLYYGNKVLWILNHSISSKQPKFLDGRRVCWAPFTIDIQNMAFCCHTKMTAYENLYYH